MAKTVGLTFDKAPGSKAPTDMFVCPTCGKEYKTEEGLAKHIEKEHKDPPQE